MHFPESAQNREHYLLGFLRFKFLFGFYFVVDESTFEQFNHNVERVIGLKHLEQFHAVAVVESPHYLDLLYQALLAFVLTVSGLLRKGLHCVITASLQFLREVNGGEVSLSDFLLGLELFVEAALIDAVLESFSPCLKILVRFESEHHFFLPLFEEDGGWAGLEAKLQIEVEGHVVFALGR